MKPINAYRYPQSRHVRRHGPDGYADYEPYREWLRDEFSFRCVFCLARETWTCGLQGFHIDHFDPVSVAPHLRTNYDNLVYTCAHCNLLRPEDILPPRPEEVAYGSCIRVNNNGTVNILNKHGRLLNDCLLLDSKENTKHRCRMLRILQAAKKTNPELYKELVGYPEDLPDLSRKQPPNNHRPNGCDESAYAKRVRGQLPDYY